MSQRRKNNNENSSLPLMAFMLALAIGVFSVHAKKHIDQIDFRKLRKKKKRSLPESDDDIQEV